LSLRAGATINFYDWSPIFFIPKKCQFSKNLLKKRFS
jgi:hypothetical protein